MTHHDFPEDTAPSVGCGCAVLFLVGCTISFIIAVAFAVFRHH